MWVGRIGAHWGLNGRTQWGLNGDLMGAEWGPNGNSIVWGLSSTAGALEARRPRPPKSSHWSVLVDEGRGKSKTKVWHCQASWALASSLAASSSLEKGVAIKFGALRIATGLPSSLVQRPEATGSRPSTSTRSHEPAIGIVSGQAIWIVSGPAIGIVSGPRIPVRSCSRI